MCPTHDEHPSLSFVPVSAHLATHGLARDHSGSELHVPGAWVDTAPGTPGTPGTPGENPAHNMNLTPQLPGNDITGVTQIPNLPLVDHSLDGSTDTAGPINRVAENPETESAEPASSEVNSSLDTASDSLDPSATFSARHAPVQPPRRSVDHSTEASFSFPQDHSHPLENVIGSTLSPDQDVQEGAKQAGQIDPDSYLVPVVPIIATLGHLNVTTTPNPQPVHPGSTHAITHSDNDHRNIEWSSPASRTSSIQQKAKELTTRVPVVMRRKKSASEVSSTTQAALSTPSKSTDSASSPSQFKSSASASSGPHSAYPLFPPSASDNGLDGLSTRTVGGDTSVTSLSTSVGNGESGNNASKTAVASAEHAPRPIFSEEHSRALETHRGQDATLSASAIAAGATAAVVAAEEKDITRGPRSQNSTSPGSPKSNRFSSIRKLTKGGKHSRSSSKSETGRAFPAGAAFPQSTYVIEDDVGLPQDLTKDPLLAPLYVSHGESGIIDGTPTPAVTAGSPEHKQHKLTKKPLPVTNGPPHVSDSSSRAFPESIGPSSGLRADLDTKSTQAHEVPKLASETGHLILVNGTHTSATKPKLMDRIKGEVKIMQGTLKGDEAKKMEGRMLKEFGSV